MPLGKGSRLGNYEIVALLGEGGMGAVYLARDHQLKRDVAIKVLTDRAVTSSENADRVLHEARSAARLNHPHICTIHEIGHAGDRAFIVMERVEGRLLSHLIPPGGMPIESVTRYGAQIAAAVAHAHEHGIVHRDLKSTNVIVTPARGCGQNEGGTALAPLVVGGGHRGPGGGGARDRRCLEDRLQGTPAARVVAATDRDVDRRGSTGDVFPGQRIHRLRRHQRARQSDLG